MASHPTEKYRIVPFCMSLAAVALGVAAYIVGVSLLDMMELQTVDLRFRSRGPRPAGADVVLVVIDEKSIAQEGKWIWPRSKIARLVTRLSHDGARVVAFDIGFLEADDRRVVQALEQVALNAEQLHIQSKGFRRLLSEMASEADQDRRLAAAIAAADAAVVLGYFFQMEPEDAQHQDSASRMRHLENISGSRYDLVRSAPGSGAGPKVIRAAAAQSNIDPISSSSPHAGFFNMFPDPDGVVRWLPAVVGLQQNYYAPLSLAALSAFLDEPLDIRLSTYGVEAIALGKRRIPTDEYGRILINYRGGPKTFRHVSATDVLQGRVAPAVFRNRIVIVGTTAQGIFDFQVTPFSNVFPGVEIHANVIDSLLASDYLRQPAWSAVFDVTAVVCLGLSLGFVLPFCGVFAGAATAACAISAYIAFTLYLFNGQGWILNMVYPVAVAVAVYILLTAYKYLMESRQRRFIKNAFSTYLAPEVVSELIESGEKLELGGEEREITAFFSDVQGFTGISERLAPPQLVELLNEFLTEMTDILLAHKGTVDKFEGDAIIAFFGAPAPQPQHAEAACLASIRMQKRLEAMRRDWRRRSLPELFMRIGMYSGKAVVGNMGSKNRMDYTMMGDTVNTAARLEGINKIYGCYTLIGEPTYRAAGERVLAREIDTVNVVGKREPVTVYQLLGESGDVSDRLLEVTGHYHRGLAAYRKRQWQRAVADFEAALAIDSGDGPSRSMRERTLLFAAAPPPQDWNGSFVVTVK